MASDSELKKLKAENEELKKQIAKADGFLEQAAQDVEEAKQEAKAARASAKAAEKKMGLVVASGGSPSARILGQVKDLAIVRFTRSFAQYNEGELAGFKYHRAKQLIKMGVAKLHSEDKAELVEKAEAPKDVHPSENRDRADSRR